MPQFDHRKAADVWQRVHATPERHAEDAGPILALIPQLGQCAQLCRGHKELSAAFARQTAALSGVYRLMTGSLPGKLPLQKPQSLTQASLQKCYACQLAALAVYEQYLSGKDFSPAFHALIPLGQNTCLMLLSLLGQ